jgi:hypothetical protein
MDDEHMDFADTRYTIHRNLVVQILTILTTIKPEGTQIPGNFNTPRMLDNIKVNTQICKTILMRSSGLSYCTLHICYTP